MDTCMPGDVGVRKVVARPKVGKSEGMGCQETGGWGQIAGCFPVWAGPQQ